MPVAENVYFIPYNSSDDQKYFEYALGSTADSSTDERYNITRKGVYDPYYLTVSDLVTSDTGSYYCCLPSNCSVNVDKDRCQQFVLTVKGRD